MRFEELAYAENGLPVTVQFHARLTVVSVPGADERSAWLERVLGVLEGTRAGDGTSLVSVDRAGRRIRLERDDQGAATLTDLATGAEVPYAAGHLPLDGRFDWFASVGLTSRKARALMVVDGAALTGDEEFDIHEVEAELNESRQRLARLEGQRQGTITRRRHLEDLRRRIADLDEQIRRSADAPARRRQAEAVLAAVPAAEEWQRAGRTLADARRAFGRRSRLDRDSQARALARPTEVPTDLEPIVGACRAAAQRRDELVARLDAGPASERATPGPATIAAGDALRRELVEEVEPAYVDALAMLAAACRPYDVSIDAARIEAAGIEAAGIEALGTEAVAEVAARAVEAGHARLQQALDEAESECRAAQERLELHLAGAGLPAGGTDDLATRVAIATARARTVDDPTPESAEDTSAVVAERSRLLKDLQRTERDLPDAAQLADRQAALEGRIDSLEASVNAGRPVPAFSEAEPVLLGRVAQARRVGRSKEPFPLVVDDVLAALRASDKAALLDRLARLGETTQIVYLTEDPDTLAWASDRVGTGPVALWQPDGLAAVAE